MDQNKQSRSEVQQPVVAMTPDPPTSSGDGPGTPCIEHLVADHYRALYAYAVRLTGKAADAEDLVQQTYLVAQQKLHQLRDIDKASSWLFTILRNCFLKKKRKRTETVGQTMLLSELPAKAVTEDEIDRQQLQAAIEQLPDEFRTVLAMYYFDEWSYKQIARRLGIPIGTVMSRLSRAKGRLRQLLFAQSDEWKRIAAASAGDQRQV